jgi:hypothetical protein
MITHRKQRVVTIVALFLFLRSTQLIPDTVQIPVPPNSRRRLCLLWIVSRQMVWEDAEQDLAPKLTIICRYVFFAATVLICESAKGCNEHCFTNFLETLEIARWNLHRVRLNKSEQNTVV